MFCNVNYKEIEKSIEEYITKGNNVTKKMQKSKEPLH